MAPPLSPRSKLNSPSGSGAGYRLVDHSADVLAALDHGGDFTVCGKDQTLDARGEFFVRLAGDGGVQAGHLNTVRGRKSSNDGGANGIDHRAEIGTVGGCRGREKTSTPKHAYWNGAVKFAEGKLAEQLSCVADCALTPTGS